MRQPSTWPELDRLARFVRAADSLTDTLAVWTGRGVGVEIVRRIDRVFPEPAIAELLTLHDGARVQEREVRMRCADPRIADPRSADLVVADARSWVAVESPALTPAARRQLQEGGGLGDLLRPAGRRRVTVRVAARRTAPAGDPATPVLAVQARLDVAGTPVAWCDETIYEAIFAWDGSRLAGVPALRPRAGCGADRGQVRARARHRTVDRLHGRPGRGRVHAARAGRLDVPDRRIRGLLPGLLCGDDRTGARPAMGPAVVSAAAERGRLADLAA
jgi:hypothetical protein